MITQTLDLNLIPGRVLPMVNASQYDKDSRTLEFTIYNGDQSFDLTGLTAYIQGLKPDGHGFNYSANISAGKITADVTEQMTAVSGRVMCEIIIMNGTDRIGTGNFILNVEAAAMPDGSNMSASEYAYIQELIEEAQEVVDEAEGYVEDAEAWARGTKNGSAVPATDPTYQNNSKYYSEEAKENEEDSEAWAVGTRNGSPVPATDPTYQNNAKYWSDQAAGVVNDMTGATASTPGTHGLVPAPAAGNQGKYLRGDGTWQTPTNTTTGDGIKTKVAQTGTAQLAITSTISADTTLDNAIGTLLDNDATLNADMGANGKYVLVASANANQTFAQQLHDLQTAFNALNGEERMASVLYFRENIFSCINISGVFTKVSSGSSAVLFQTMYIPDEKYYQSSGSTPSDESAVTNAYAMQLRVMRIK